MRSALCLLAACCILLAGCPGHSAWTAELPRQHLTPGMLDDARTAETPAASAP